MDLRRHLILPLAAVLVAGGVGACGNKGDNEGRVVRADTEGVYLDISGLKYQVQVSRQLNPSNIEDRTYLEGLPRKDRGLKPGELWFAVFMRVQNDKSHIPLAPSNDIKITDTQNNVYRPIPLAHINAFAYRSDRVLTPGEIMPDRDSLAGAGPTQGSLLLFKVTDTSLDNRPLVMTIEGRRPPLQTGLIDLDV